MPTITYSGLTEAQRMAKLALEQQITDLEAVYTAKVTEMENAKLSVTTSYSPILQSIQNAITEAQNSLGNIKGTVTIHD